MDEFPKINAPLYALLLVLIIFMVMAALSSPTVIERSPRAIRA